jgi:EPS-associated MarR family transcriptional regulator
MNNSKTNDSSSLEDTYKILSLFDEESVSTQRDISKHLGYSLGKVNYLVNSLIQKGFVKLDNFIKNENKSGYYYILTPSGIEEKYKITKEFLKRKEAEYDALRRDIEKIKSKIG